VEIDGDEAVIGLRVKVRFEQIEDVWLPLFEPLGSVPEVVSNDALPLDEVSAAPWKFVRPMVTTDKFESKSAITGIGMSRIGRHLNVPPLELTLDACEAALADSGLIDDIDGLSAGPGPFRWAAFTSGVLAVEDALGVGPLAWR
jgi:hypothetical protein